MHRRHIFLVTALALVLVAGLTFGILGSSAQGSEPLPSTTPAELLTKVAEAVESDLSLSGDFTVTSRLLGPLSMLGGAGGPAGLMQGGEGRLWTQDGKARVDLFGRAGADTSLYFVDHRLTVYDPVKNKVTTYALPKWAAASRPDTTRALPPSVDLQRAIAAGLAELAPQATVTMGPETVVAGRTCYVLTLAPNSERSLFASLQVAIDGETFVPLQVEVFARGTEESVFAAGLTKVSYDPVSDDIFTVPAPPGAQVEQKELKWPCPVGTDGKALKEALGLENLKPLTLAEAEARAGFSLLTPETSPAYPFQGAYVIDVPENMPAAGLLPGGTGLPPGMEIDLAAWFKGPVVVLVYGEGFETVMLLETPVPAPQAMVLAALLGQVPLFSSVPVNGTIGFEFSMPLASALLWAQQGVGVVALGGVPSEDLRVLAAGVR